MISTKFFKFSRYRSYDLVTALYLIIWIFLIVLFYSKIYHAELFLIFHFLALIFTLSFAGIFPSNHIVSFFRNWYPVFYLPLFFTALHYLIPQINPDNVDHILISLDISLTGTYPTVWMENFNYPLLTEILELSYLTFYFLPLLVLIPLYIRKRETLFNEAALAFLLGFYLSYFGYLTFPALGPRYFLASVQTSPLASGGFYHSIASALNGLENIQWDAFPSGHVTIALLFSHYAYLYFRKTFYWALPVVILLVISTIYLRYHYLVDVFAGIILYGIIIIICRKLK